MSRPRAKRFLGMTIPQWGMLGVILLCMCGTVAGGYAWLNSQVAAAYVLPELEMPPTAPVVTPLPTLTSAPTATATVTPSPTPITYESLIPAGWHRFEDVGVEFWVPSSYEFLPVEDLGNQVSIFGADAPPLILVLWDATPSPFLMNTSMQALSRRPFASSLDEMIDASFDSLSREGRLLEREEFKFILASFDARRLIFDANTDGINVGLVFYVVYTDHVVYYLGFKTPFNELYTRLPEFDAIVQTFRLSP